MNLWTLPERAEIGGRGYAVNADYRDALGIISRLNAPEEPEEVRVYVSLSLFYEGFAEMPEEDYPEAIRWMFRFLGGGEEDDGARPRYKTIDWEQDKGLIVADINRVAGCEIRALPFCHWWTFLAWFNGIGDGQLSTVVSIREKRRKGKKLDQWEREFYQEHKDMVDFKRRYTAEDLAEKERLKKLLGE